jgi:ElaB/YqjD/DUF883 family membrane-anchored ribosome-binding protein
MVRGNVPAIIAQGLPETAQRENRNGGMMKRENTKASAKRPDIRLIDGFPAYHQQGGNHMKTETDRTQTPEDVLNELRSLVSEAERILAETSPGGRDCDAMLEALRERMRAAQERLASAYKETRQKVVAGAKYADETIRDNPYQSIAIALGVGLLAGALLGRRWSSSSK